MFQPHTRAILAGPAKVRHLAGAQISRSCGRKGARTESCKRSVALGVFSQAKPEGVRQSIIGLVKANFRNRLE
jgi:hypothetical protein